VNIAAVMTVLDEWELDHMAKMALLVVCCRADQRGMARVSIRRVAADMKVHYLTAARALDRAVDAGYLAVDKSSGQTSIWHLTARPQYTNRATSAYRPRDSGSRIRILKDIEGGDAARLKAASPVENLPVTCPDCADHSGWVWHHDGVMRCPHG
jgi:hypothetical protein